MSEERIFDKLEAMSNDLAQVKQDVAILKNREQPSSPCRSHIEAIRIQLAEKDSDLKHEMTALASGLHKKIDNDCKSKVDKYTFGKMMAGFGSIIGILAYWVWDIVRGIK